MHSLCYVMTTSTQVIVKHLQESRIQNLLEPITQDWPINTRPSSRLKHAGLVREKSSSFDMMGSREAGSVISRSY